MSSVAIECIAQLLWKLDPVDVIFPSPFQLMSRRQLGQRIDLKFSLLIPFNNPPSVHIGPNVLNILRILINAIGRLQEHNHIKARNELLFASKPRELHHVGVQFLHYKIIDLTVIVIADSRQVATLTLKVHLRGDGLQSQRRFERLKNPVHLLAFFLKTILAHLLSIQILRHGVGLIIRRFPIQLY